MTYAAREDRILLNHLKLLVRAAHDVHELGSVPVYGKDREEQDLIDRHRKTTHATYARVERRLLDHIDRRVNK